MAETETVTEKEVASEVDQDEVSGDSLLDEIMKASKMPPTDDGYQIAKKGVEAFISELLAPGNEIQRVEKKLVDQMIGEIDTKISVQVDEILHDEQFQALESAWRGLKMVVDRTDFKENVKIEVLNVAKEDLREDFEDATDITHSGLYKLAYTAEYGQFGGEPYGTIVGNYDFNPELQDITLLKNLASVAAMAHAPFVAAAGPKFFGIDNFYSLPNLKDISAIFSGPQYAHWRSFRESEDSRFVSLTLPRFLLREPYDSNNNPVKTFHYDERVTDDHSKYLWGNTAFAFASRLADSFAKYRWCPNIIGPQSGGTVDNMILHKYEAMGEIQTKIPTEILISERKEYELSEEGFIGLAMRKGSDNACFFSANSCQKPKFFGNSPEDKVAETNYKLGTQLPYIFIVSRLAHYIKVIQRENIGSWKEGKDIERELNHWIRNYISDMDNPADGVRGRRPLRQANVNVTEVEGETGWYKVDLHVRPHFKYMGAYFTLSLVGKLDKNE